MPSQTVQLVEQKHDFMTSANPASAHLVGICGAGMRALAETLMDLGCKLSGSDLAPAPKPLQKLIDRGLVFHRGHAAGNVPLAAQQLIYSPAIGPDNVERAEAKHRNLPEFSYSQAVNQLIQGNQGVCIAGTHGKSTTTAMTATILDQANRLRGVVLGAEVCDSGRSGWTGHGDLFVAESCEFQRSFLDYAPRYSAILTVEPDHFDCYPDLESLQTAFTDFASRTHDEGILVFNDDSPASAAVSRRATTAARRVSFGTRHTADWQATDFRQTANGTRFQLSHQGRSVIPIELLLHGHHNMWNALAAAALTAEIGVSPVTIQQALAGFHGVRRRLERIGERKGIELFDDYAHHPTAVKVTLETLRTIAGPHRRIWCVFQPHQVLRTAALMSNFATSFATADEVIVAPIFAARETVTDEPQTLSNLLAERISACGVNARFYPSLDQIVNTLEDAARPGDIIVTMGAGDIDRIHYELTRRIQ